MLKIAAFGGSILPRANEKALAEAEQFLNKVGRANLVKVDIHYIGTSGTLRIIVTYQE